MQGLKLSPQLPSRGRGWLASGRRDKGEGVGVAGMGGSGLEDALIVLKDILI